MNTPTETTATNNSGQVVDNSTTQQQMSSVVNHDALKVQSDTLWQPQQDNYHPVTELGIEHITPTPVLINKNTDTQPLQEELDNNTPTVVPEETEENIEPLSKEEIVFSRLVARGYSYTTAYRKAFESKRDKSYGYIRKLAFELATKHNIKTEIATVKDTTARLARLSEDRIEEILIDGDIHARGTRVPDVAMFMYDHANGKAKQSTEIISRSISVNIDLTGNVTDTENN